MPESENIICLPENHGIEKVKVYNGALKIEKIKKSRGNAMSQKKQMWVYFPHSHSPHFNASGSFSPHCLRVINMFPR